MEWNGMVGVWFYIKIPRRYGGLFYRNAWRLQDALGCGYRLIISLWFIYAQESVYSAALLMFSFLIYSSHSLTRVGKGSKCNSLGDNVSSFSFS